VWVNLDKGLIKEAIAEFEKQCAMALIPELADGEWLERCAHLVGMDGEGHLLSPGRKGRKRGKRRKTQ
jgi:hypothetical protein